MALTRITIGYAKYVRTLNNFSDANTALKSSGRKKFTVNNFITVITHIYNVKMSM